MAATYLQKLARHQKITELLAMGFTPGMIKQAELGMDAFEDAIRQKKIRQYKQQLALGAGVGGIAGASLGYDVGSLYNNGGYGMLAGGALGALTGGFLAPDVMNMNNRKQYTSNFDLLSTALKK